MMPHEHSVHIIDLNTKQYCISFSLFDYIKERRRKKMKSLMNIYI